VRPLIVDLGKDFRGGQHQALFLLQGFSARGHAPELIAIGGSQLARRAKDAGISVHGVTPGLRRLSAAREVRRLVSGKRVDLVHANEPHALSAAWLARAHRSVPVIVSRRIAVPLGSGSISRARYRAAARIVAVSLFVKQSVIAGGFPPGSVEVIYDGVEIPLEISTADRESARSKLKVPRQGFCVGNAAAFVPEKGHALLLRAFAGLRKIVQAQPPVQPPEKVSGCVLLLRGEGPEQPALQKLARELQISEDVRFLPPEQDIETMFAALDVFAFPSHAEPLGSALLAAMAHTLPCVALARGGVPEVIENENTGLLIENPDSTEFAATLARLQKDPESARRIGEAARRTIATRFSADHMVEATLNLYGKVTGAL
jgi:L-malate glycosyltransferase